MKGPGVSPWVWAGRSPRRAVGGWLGGMAGSPLAEACRVRGPPALGRAWGQTGKGKACRTPVGWALFPPPVPEFGVQLGPRLPWGLPVSPNGPSRQKWPSPDPSARRHPPTKGPGGLGWTVLPQDKCTVWAPSVLGGSFQGTISETQGPHGHGALGFPVPTLASVAPAVPQGHLVCEALGGWRGPCAP